ncbi:MAG: metal ABC transporter permease [Alphaproteobacteria bacterium]|nr:metal ABC transporter permease [Alphaproteobacteria bacterium]
MRRALVACLALSLGSAPVGVFLVLRRMSLLGDALSHAILPGAAVGFVFGGLSLWPMSLGGFVAAVVVALLSGWVARTTRLREDASFAGFYLIALALGVLLISTHGSPVDLMHVLFGSVLAVDNDSLLLVAAVASFTTLALALIWRPLVVECVDPGFLKAVGGHGGATHMLFMALVVVNLVAGFQALGTLMAVGLMMLPAAAARFWASSIEGMALVGVLLAMLASVVGLLFSFHFQLASGPSIVLVAGLVYVASLLAGPRESVLRRYFPGQHLEA